MPKHDTFMKALKERGSKKASQFRQARPTQQFALDQLDASIQQAGDWLIDKLGSGIGKAREFPPVRAVLDPIEDVGEWYSQLRNPKQEKWEPPIDAEALTTDEYRDYEGLDPWKNIQNIRRRQWEESQQPMTTWPTIKKPERAPTVLARTAASMVIDPETGLPDPIPGPSPAAIVTPAMRMKKGAQLMHPTDLRRMLKQQNAPVYAQQAPDMLVDEAMRLDAVGDTGAEAWLAASRFLNAVPATDRAAALGRGAAAVRLRNQIAGQLDMPVEALTDANQLLQDLDPDWIARRGVSNEMRTLKEQDKAIRQSGAEAAQMARSTPLTREMYLKGVGDPESIDLLTSDPFEGFTEMGWTEEQINTKYPEHGFPLGYQTGGPEHSAIFSSETFGRVNPDTTLHEILHRGHRGGGTPRLRAAQLDYSTDVLGENIGSGSTYPSDMIAPGMKHPDTDELLPSYRRQDDETLLEHKRSVLEESLVRDTVDYANGTLEDTVLDQLSDGIKGTREQKVFEWMQKNLEPPQ